MVDTGSIIAILCRQSICVFSRLKFYDKIFLSHNTELLFVKEVIFVLGCSRNLRGKIPRLHWYFWEVHKPEEKGFIFRIDFVLTLKVQTSYKHYTIQNRHIQYFRMLTSIFFFSNIPRGSLKIDFFCFLSTFPSFPEWPCWQYLIKRFTEYLRLEGVVQIKRRILMLFKWEIGI